MSEYSISKGSIAQSDAVSQQQEANASKAKLRKALTKIDSKKSGEVKSDVFFELLDCVGIELSLSN